ncbi:MAG: DUF3570 domain-containing protein [Gammaproteobacteria bacterium]|nr:DUF3570 domain-containing protein [Gammaproteobacteria bacterium]
MAVIDSMRRFGLVGLVLCLAAPPVAAAVLPADRADVMYHGYDGGGLTVEGPSVLVRKGFADKVSVWGNYYVDMISSASIDVVTTASPYDEERTEVSAGVDYLYGKTFMGLSYTNSDESDYTSNNVRFGISQDFFGDLTTLGISYVRGWDEVRRNGDDEFGEEIDRQSYRVDVSQVITKNMVLNLNYEGITDEGFLNNPYRSVRYVDPSSARGYSYEAEIYPRTKTSSSIAARSVYYLPYRAAARAEYRYYTDTWGISAWNVEVGYVHPLPKGIMLDVRYRYYDQDAADFYSDLFPRQNYQNFLARDKELSTFTSHTIGMGVTYEFGTRLVPFFKKGEVSLVADFLRLQYDDFRDVRKTTAAGSEPLYELDATVIRAFISVWY